MKSASAVLGAASRELPLRLAVAKWVGYFALIDLLFLPYFQGIIIPYGLPVLLLVGAIVGLKIEQDRYLFAFLFLSLAVVASFVLSVFLLNSDTWMVENFKRVIQMLSSFLYFFYFRWIAKKAELDITPIIVVFAFWFVGLGVSFVISPVETGELIRSIYGRLATDEDTLAEHLRFAYVFTDPNTGAYFFLIAASFILVSSNLSTQRLIALFFLLATGTLFTQSRGALIALVLVFLVTLIRPGGETRLPRLRSIVVFAVVLAAALVPVYQSFSDLLEEYRALSLSFLRLFESQESYVRGGNRFEIWWGVVNNLLPLPLGRGYSLSIGGALYAPHSDFLRMFYSYGFLALIPMLYFLFGRFLAWPPLIIPSLMAFLTNTLIDEQKLFSLFLVLLAILVAKRGTGCVRGGIRRFRQGEAKRP